MLAPKCATYNGRLTFANPKYLKTANLKNPDLYEIPFDTSDPANKFAPEREETMTLDNESRSKLNKDIDLESSNARQEQCNSEVKKLIENCKEYLSRVNPRASAQNKDAKSHKTTKRYMLIEKSSASKKPKRQIHTGHRFSNKKTIIVPEKRMNPRSCLRWQLTGRILKTVGLRWVPTGKLFNSCTSKVENEPTHGSNVDIHHILACKKTLSLSAGTSFNGQKQQRIDLNADALYKEKQENLRVCSSLVLHQMTSDHNHSELEIHDHSNEPSNSKLVPKVGPLAVKTATSRQELELLFHHHKAMLRTTGHKRIDNQRSAYIKMRLNYAYFEIYLYPYFIFSCLSDMSNSDELRHTDNTTLVPPRLPDTLPQVYHMRHPTLGLLIFPSVSPFPPTIRRTARISIPPIEPNLPERARISAINLDDYQLDPVTPPPSPSSPFTITAYQRMIAETDPTQREEALTETGQNSVPVPETALTDVKPRVEESSLETLSMDELITQLRKMCEDAENRASNAQEEAQQKRKEALEEVVQQIYRTNN
ncbi:hypothetical protein Tco_0486681 [Tanacetum coccineum]